MWYGAAVLFQFSGTCCCFHIFAGSTSACWLVGGTSSHPQNTPHPPFSLWTVLLQDNKMKIYCRRRHAATAATKSTQHCRCPKKGYERRLGNFFVGRSSPPKPSPTFLCYETEIIADFFHFGREPRPNKNKNILCSKLILRVNQDYFI